jgi:hypothetical protein
VLLNLLAGLLAQTCATMLPSTALEFEWFRDGRPYAHDTLIRTRSGERLYQRRFASGETAERVVSCTSSGGAIYLTDRVGRSAPIRIPVGLVPGSTRNVGSTRVRRVPAPPGAPPNMIWFTVASPGVLMYGMRRAAGITEIRTPVRGGYSVVRAIARDRASRAAADSQFAAMAQRIEELENENRQLRDSLRTRGAALPPLPEPVPQSPEGRGRAQPRNSAGQPDTSEGRDSAECCARPDERRP